MSGARRGNTISGVSLRTVGRKARTARPTLAKGCRTVPYDHPRKGDVVRESTHNPSTLPTPRRTVVA